MTDSQANGPDWKRLYETVVKRFGFHDDAPPGKRKTPRFNFNPPEKVLLVQVGYTTGVLTDISAGGLAFQLNFPLKVGRRLPVKIDLKFAADVEVVSTLLEEFETRGFRDIHRVRCKFLGETDGFRCVVQTLGLASTLAPS